MKKTNRLFALLAIVLLFCMILTSCELLDVQQVDEPASTEPSTTDKGGETEMTTERPDETEDGTAAPETTVPTTTVPETAAPHVHEFGPWTVETPASCTSDGVEKRICSTCRVREERTIDAPGHTAPDGNGKCTRCGVTLVPTSNSYPMDQVTPLNGTIVTSSNKYAVMKNYLGAVIDLKDLAFNTVTITKRSGVSEMGYAFLTALPVDKEVPSYAKGYDMVIWDENDTATLFIPEDARYLYVYYYDSGVSYLPSSIVFSNTTAPSTFTVASWNIGHYSMGGNKNTKLTDDQYATEKAKYDAYIDSLGADVLILNEYSKMFTPSNAARYLFLDYGCPFEGEQRNYSCNALYAKLPLKNVTLREFACNTPDTVLHTTVIKATDYYYITGELTVDGKTVTIVGLHLAFNDNLHPNDTVCTAQMDELIATFANTERVVILGDWNAYNADYYDRFADAGYTVANTGQYLTCTGSRTGGLEWPVDNIIVKGVTMTNFHVVNTSLSDHIAVVATISVP